MRFEPLVPLWLLLPYAVVALAAASWQIWRIRNQKRTIVLRWSRRAALLLLPVLIALGPSIAGGTSSPGVSNLDIIFAVDTTPSMGALDYDGTQQRIVGIRNDLLALANKLQGARMEIITFDSNPNVILPFTTDVSSFSSAVQGITPEVSDYSQGTAIDLPLSSIIQQFKASKAAYPAHKRLLFYLSDGEQTINQPVQSFAPIAPYINGGAVLGYGTTTGAKMIDYGVIPSSSSQPSYIQTIDPSNDQLVPGISHMDPTALQSIASQLKVSYLDRDQGGTISNIYNASQAARSIDNSQHIVHYLSLYWFLAIPLAILIFWEWQIQLRDLLELREHTRGRHA